MDVLGIRFLPLCAESLGVRSLAVKVETKKLHILLDAGVSLGSRFGIVPHPKEYVALKEARKRIREEAKKCDLITISHYHFDHYTPTWREIDAKWTWSSYDEAKEVYEGKVVLAKDIRSRINPSQRMRGYIFSKVAKEFVKELSYVDGESMSFDDIRLRFSPPLPHGEDDTALGYVLLITIQDGDEKFLYCPDVQGPVSSTTLRYILELSPSVAIVGGPPLYLAGSKVKPEMLSKGLAHLERIVSKVPLTIVDHHILRDEQGLRELERLKKAAKEKGNEVRTFAEQLGLKNELLEARRRDLYEESPPDREFQKWMKLPPSRQRQLLPPL